MPAVPKTSRDQILLSVLEIIDEGGVEALTMVEVARRVGIRGPSLYKHFPDRESLLRSVEGLVIDELGTALQESERTVQAFVLAYLGFARAKPQRYSLLFSLNQLDEAEAVSVRSRALRPVLEVLVPLTGSEAAALLRARVITSFLHGFVSMERSGAFRLGAVTDEIVETGLKLILPEAVEC